MISIKEVIVKSESDVMCFNLLKRLWQTLMLETKNSAQKNTAKKKKKRKKRRFRFILRARIESRPQNVFLGKFLCASSWALAWLYCKIQNLYVRH